MRIHCLQHVDFEGPAAILPWAREAGHGLMCSRLDRGDGLPRIEDFDLLVIVGGPMSVNDERQYPWLAEEKRLVQKVVESERAVLGICLGAQLIASALGANVYRGRKKEIGWFPVSRVTGDGLGNLLPELFTPLHWHGETFDLPAGAMRLAETEAVPNQAFQVGDRVIGLQFHLEATPESVGALVANAAHDIQAGEPFQQPPEAILERTPEASAAVRPVLHRLLSHLAGMVDGCRQAW